MTLSVVPLPPGAYQAALLTPCPDDERDEHAACSLACSPRAGSEQLNCNNEDPTDTTGSTTMNSSEHEWVSQSSEPHRIVTPEEKTFEPSSRRKNHAEYDRSSPVSSCTEESSTVETDDTNPEERQNGQAFAQCDASASAKAEDHNSTTPTWQLEHSPLPTSFYDAVSAAVASAKAMGKLRQLLSDHYDDPNDALADSRNVKRPFEVVSDGKGEIQKSMKAESKSFYDTVSAAVASAAAMGKFRQLLSDHHDDHAEALGDPRNVKRPFEVVSNGKGEIQKSMKAEDSWHSQREMISKKDAGLPSNEEENASRYQERDDGYARNIVESKRNDDEYEVVAHYVGEICAIGSGCPQDDDPTEHIGDIDALDETNMSVVEASVPSPRRKIVEQRKPTDYIGDIDASDELNIRVIEASVPSPRKPVEKRKPTDDYIGDIDASDELNISVVEASIPLSRRNASHWAVKQLNNETAISAIVKEDAETTEPKVVISGAIYEISCDPSRNAEDAVEPTTVTTTEVVLQDVVGEHSSSDPSVNAEDAVTSKDETLSKVNLICDTEMGDQAPLTKLPNNNCKPCTFGSSPTFDGDESADSEVTTTKVPETLHCNVSAEVMADAKDGEEQEEVQQNVKNLRGMYEKQTIPASEDVGFALALSPSKSKGSSEASSDEKSTLTPRDRSRGLFPSSTSVDSVSELSSPHITDFGVGSGMEAFYRQQKLQKFAERKKLQETWNRYHCDKETTVVVSLLTQPTVHARTYGEPSPSSMDSAIKGRVLVDYKFKDYRGFVFLVHNDHGLMLLHCTRKKNKPPHWQLPGGHVDEAEFLEAANQSQDRDTQLILACKAGAARELFEETGLDIRSQLNRLEPAQLRSNHGKPINELKNRLFFFLQVIDSDFPKDGMAPLGTLGVNLRLQISHEHSGFTFEPEPNRAAEMLHHHSGGKCSEALLLAMTKDKEKMVVPVREDDDTDEKMQARTNAPAPSTLDYGRPVNIQTEEQIETLDSTTLDVFPKPKKRGGLLCCFGL